MAGLDSFANITKISDSLYEVTGGDAVLDSTLDALVENVTIVQKDGGWLVYGSSLTSTFERCTIIETSTAKALGTNGYKSRFMYNTSPTFKGCHFILEHGTGRGRMNFSAFDPCTPKFLKSDYGTPCRLSRIVPIGTDGDDRNGSNFHRYGTFDGFVVTSKSYVTGFPKPADFSIMSNSVNLLDVTLTGNDSYFEIQTNLTNYSVVRGIGAYQIATFQYYLGDNLDLGEDEWGNITGLYGTNENNTTTTPIKTYIMVDTKGWLRQNEWDYWRQKANLMFKRTFRSTPVDPTTLNAISVTGYLKNTDSGRIYVDGETNGIDEQLLQYRYRAYMPKTGKQVTQTDADGNLIATGDFLIFEDHYIRGFIAYDKLPSARNFQVVNNENGDPTEELVLMSADASVSETDKAVVDGYLQLDTPEKFYDRAKAFLTDNYAGEAATIVSREGTTIDAGTYNVTIDASAAEVFAFDGSTITLKATQFVGSITGSGTFTLLNGAEVVGTFGGTTVYSWEVSNVEAGSTLQLFNTTQDIEIENLVVSGTAGTKVTATGTYATSEAVPGDAIRLRLTCQAGTSALLPFETVGVATASGVSFRADQQPDTIYNANNIDGSSISGITLTPDYANIQIDLDDQEAPYEISAQAIYNYYAYLITTAHGIANFYGAITPVDQMNYKINASVVPLKIQNTGSTDVVLNGGRLYRDDGVSVLDTGAGSGTGSIMQDTGFLVQYIQPQVSSALTTYGAATSTNVSDTEATLKKKIVQSALI